jgi:chemotaxis protein MotB
MSDEKPTLIVVKRIKKGGHGHHGGAWKIAYADFVTAMMAFFLLMWLLGSTTRGNLQGIADYFKTPLKVALRGGDGSGDSSSVIKGGGKALSHTTGQVEKNDHISKDHISLRAANAEVERHEMMQLQKLKAKIESAIHTNPRLQQFSKQILLEMTPEGLRLQIVDTQNRPMFAMGSAKLEPYTIDILHEVGLMLNDVSNKVSLSGHTDATPYAGGEKGYSNWELSADRANASRRELIAGGMDQDKVLRVTGQASSLLLNKKDPYDPINRRISILVMNKQAEEAANNESGAIQIGEGATLEQQAIDRRMGDPPRAAGH